MLDIDNRYDMFGLAGKSAVNETVRDSKGLTCVGSLYFRYKLLILFCGHEGRVRSVSGALLPVCFWGSTPPRSIHKNCHNGRFLCWGFEF